MASAWPRSRDPYGYPIRGRPGSTPDVASGVSGEAAKVRLDPLSALVVPALWAAAGVLAGCLPRARTGRSLRRRSALLLLALVCAAAAGLAVSTPLVAVAAAITLGLATPRLVRLARRTASFAAAGSRTPAPPLLRAAAAHPAVAVPIQATAYLSIAAPLATSTSAAPVAPALALAVVVTLHGHAIRHRRIAESALLPPPSPVPFTRRLV